MGAEWAPIGQKCKHIPDPAKMNLSWIPWLHLQPPIGTFRCANIDFAIFTAWCGSVWSEVGFFVQIRVKEIVQLVPTIRKAEKGD